MSIFFTLSDSVEQSAAKTKVPELAQLGHSKIFLCLACAGGLLSACVLAKNP